MKCSKDQSNKISDISIRQSWHTFPVDPCEVGHDSNGISHSEFQVISFSRFSLEQNRINNLHFNSSVTQVMARMCAQSKSTKSTARICVRRPQFIAYLLYVSPYVCDLSVSWTCLFAFVRFQGSVWLYEANIDQLLLHPKPPLCPLYCTKSSLQLTLYVYTNAHINTQNALGVTQHADWTWVKVIHLSIF